MAKRTVRDVDWEAKRALVRVDFNVPFERGAKRISDDVRIREAIPTINFLRTAGASVVLCTHLGRPGGKPSSEFELAPIAERLAYLLGTAVDYVHDAPGDDAKSKASALRSGDVLLIENVRFWPGEEANDDEFAKALAALGDVYVNDAFGTAHRAHASTEGVAHILPAVAGLLMEKEITFLGGVLEDPKRPLAALLGGAKVSDKIKVLERLIGHADALFVGGGMAWRAVVVERTRRSTSRCPLSRYARRRCREIAPTAPFANNASGAAAGTVVPEPEDLPSLALS